MMLELHMLGAFDMYDDSNSGDSDCGDALLMGVLEPLGRSLKTCISPLAA
jgi:hypothetical protein